MYFISSNLVFVLKFQIFVLFQNLKFLNCFFFKTSIYCQNFHFQKKNEISFGEKMEFLKIGKIKKKHGNFGFQKFQFFTHFSLENKFVIPRVELCSFVSELCRLSVGIIRSSYPFGGTRTSISSSLWFALLIPITKLLRSLLDRATRIEKLVDEKAWLVEFPISDISGNFQYSHVYRGFRLIAIIGEKLV